jgi:hypothetical protein
MTAIKTKSLSIIAADIIMRDFADLTGNSSYYLTLGKTTPWANDAAPSTPSDTVLDEIGVWNSMIFAKKITGNDVSLVVRRHDWAANTIYTSYTHLSDLQSNANAQYYIVTSDFNVYKCIDNNNGGPSTVEPTYTNPAYVNRTIDNYVWKYLYTVSRAQRHRFLTDEWLPIRDLTVDDGSVQWDVQEASVDGAVNAIIITNPGSGYTNTANVTITILGDGESAAAVVTLNTVSNTVNSVIMTNPGRDYSNAVATISGGAGSGALVVPILSPFGGHGSDIVEELGASTIMINIRVRDTESDLIPVGNDFRQVSIVHNPTNFGTSNIANASAISQVMTVYLLGSGTSYVDDEFVYQGASLAGSTFSGRVSNFDSPNNKLRLANTSGTISAALLLGANSTASRFVSSTVDPGLTKYSGNILYIDNTIPVTRNSDQTEDLKIAITF